MQFFLASATLANSKYNRWIVYTKSINGISDLYIISPEDDSAIKMGLTQFSPGAPSWSPDWQMLVFSGSGGDIYIVCGEVLNVPR